MPDADFENLPRAASRHVFVYGALRAGGSNDIRRWRTLRGAAVICCGDWSAQLATIRRAGPGGCLETNRRQS